MQTLTRRAPDRKPTQPEIDPTWLNCCDRTCFGHYMSSVRGYDWNPTWSDPADAAELRGYRIWIGALWAAEESDPGPDPMPYQREAYAALDISNLLLNPTSV